MINLGRDVTLCSRRGMAGNSRGACRGGDIIAMFVALALLLTGQGAMASAAGLQASTPTPGGTTYGGSVYRQDDANGRFESRRFIPSDVTAPAEVLLQQLWLKENEVGAYSPALVPALRELGAALFMDEQYPDAIETYRRAIHLLRVNEGLNTPLQQGMIEQLVEAYVETGDYLAADDQQRYLFRIRRQHLAPDDPAMLDAVDQLAHWHRSAYLSEFDRVRYPRIVELFDLYHDMATAVGEQNGEASRARLPYLEGKLRTAYLLSVYPGEKDLPGQGEQRNNADTSDVTRLRFSGFRKDNFRRGLAAILEMHGILAADPNATPQELADVLVMKGDWYQWHHRLAQAVTMYEAAWAAVEGQPDAQRWRRANFDNPRELPAGQVFQPGRIPLRLYYGTDVHVRFAVTRLGEAQDIEILAPDRADNQPAVTQGYKYLRSMRFRPRLEAGVVVATESVERIYNLRY